MEIRLLTIDEIPQALGLARGVFNYCLQDRIQFPQMGTMFENYTRQENVRSMMEEGRLAMWGAYEREQLVAVSAMQSEGHITMLYVLPDYQRRGYGQKLLLAMRSYAYSEYGHGQVTLNAMPSWTAHYFKKRKFHLMNNSQPADVPFISMYAKTIAEVDYTVRDLSTGSVLAVSIGGLVVCTLVAVAYMVHYLEMIM